MLRFSFVWLPVVLVGLVGFGCGGKGSPDAAQPLASVVPPAATSASTTLTPVVPAAAASPPAPTPISGTDKLIDPTLPPVLPPSQTYAAPLSQEQYQQQLAPFGWMQVTATNADVTGDGQPEALVTGSFGMHGRAVFVMQGASVIFDEGGDDANITATADHNGFEITQPLRMPNEAFCCSSWFYVKSNAWNGNGFTASNEVKLRSFAEINNQPATANQPTPQMATVDLFYTLLRQKQLPQAYALLSPAEQARQPFAAWSGGYTNLQSVTIEDLKSVSSTQVYVKFKAADGPVVTAASAAEYEGTWQFAAGTGSPTLDAPSLKKLSP